ncbi:unnamed protein product [Ectocarpus sp. 4 AP-2014]
MQPCGLKAVIRKAATTGRYRVILRSTSCAAVPSGVEAMPAVLLPSEAPCCCASLWSGCRRRCFCFLFDDIVFDTSFGRQQRSLCLLRVGPGATVTTRKKSRPRYLSPVAVQAVSWVVVLCLCEYRRL